MEMLNMSTKEISRLGVIQKVNDKRMSQKEAGAILNLGVQRFQRSSASKKEKYRVAG